MKTILLTKYRIVNKIQLAFSLIKSKMLIQLLIILNIFSLNCFAHVGSFTKCCAISSVKKYLKL